MNYQRIFEATDDVRYIQIEFRHDKKIAVVVTGNVGHVSNSVLILLTPQLRALRDALNEADLGDEEE